MLDYIVQGLALSSRVHRFMTLFCPLSGNKKGKVVDRNEKDSKASQSEQRRNPLNLLRCVKALTVFGLLAIMSPVAYCQNVELWSTNVGVYDDSWQPPSCEWRNEGVFGTPSLHCGKARALRHTLKLAVYGPNDAYIRQAIQGCVQQGAIAGVIASIGAGTATGGSGSGAGLQVFINYVAACVGGQAAQSISAQIDDHSIWIEL